MKKYIYSLIAIFALFAASCRKSDNPRIPELQRVPLPLVTFDPAGSASFSTASPAASAAFSQHITVDVFWKSDIPPKSMDLVVRKNNNNGNVKLVQGGITTYPTVVAVTGTQIISLMGAVTPGDVYDFGVNITTQNGAVYDAFPSLGVGYGSGVLGEYAGDPTLNNGKGAQVQVQFVALCAYDPAIYQGNFVVVKDGWADTAPGDIIVLTQIDATHFSFNYNPTNHAGTLVNSQPIIVTVDPVTNTPSVALQTVGTAWTYDAALPAPTAKTTPGANNFLFPCAKTVSLNMTWTEGTGSFGGLAFSLRKQ